MHGVDACCDLWNVCMMLIYDEVNDLYAWWCVCSHDDDDGVFICFNLIYVYVIFQVNLPFCFSVFVLLATMTVLVHVNRWHNRVWGCPTIVYAKGLLV